MLVIRGTVVAVEPTKGGKWDRIIVGTGRRVNDLVMVEHGSVPAEVGKALELPVYARVETTEEGRPTRNITYWHDTPRKAAAASA